MKATNQKNAVYRRFDKTGTTHTFKIFTGPIRPSKKCLQSCFYEKKNYKVRALYSTTPNQSAAECQFRRLYVSFSSHDEGALGNLRLFHKYYIVMLRIAEPGHPCLGVANIFVVYSNFELEVDNKHTESMVSVEIPMLHSLR